MMKTRLYYLDWLRLFAFGMLILFHAWRPFDSFGWHVKDTNQSAIFDHLTMFFHSWRLSLIFLVSGAGTWFAMRSRKDKFVVDRVFRLMIPYLFAIILLVPPQRFVEAMTYFNFDGSYFEFLGGYIDIVLMKNVGIDPGWSGHLGYHVWYLAFLFLQTLVLLPLFKLIAKERISLNWLTRLISKPATIYLLVLPIIAFQFALKPIFPWYTSWTDFFVFGMYVLYGYLFMKNEKLIQIVKQNTWIFLTIGFITSFISHYLVILNHPFVGASQTPGHTVNYLIGSSFGLINGFSWVMFFLGLAAKYFTRKSSYLAPLNQSILPIYVLHQTVIVLFAFYIKSWELPIIAKFGLIALVTIVACWILYLIINRFMIFRLIFGLKLKKPNLIMKHKVALKPAA